jgi:hypothetical protein
MEKSGGISIGLLSASGEDGYRERLRRYSLVLSKECSGAAGNIELSSPLRWP